MATMKRIGRALLVLEFAIISGWYIVIAVFWERGADARIYYRAAEAGLAGGNPWGAGYNGVLFAGPPPTLLPIAPFTLLPEDAFVAFMIGGSVVAAVLALRKLRLPAYWLLFPPIVEGVTVGNPNVFVIALLVLGGSSGVVVATFAKVYAVVPMLLLGRWKAVAWTTAALLLTAPLLPWGMFLGSASEVTGTLAAQSEGGKSAWAFLPLVPLVGLCLVLLGRERAAWLAVPALWPATQVHYAVLALPVLRNPAVAAIAALPVPFAIPLVVVLWGVWRAAGWAQEIRINRPSAASLA